MTQKMTDKSGEQLLSGNFDEIGATDNVLAKISSESRGLIRTSIVACNELKVLFKYFN